MHEEIIAGLAKRLYDRQIMDNRERGDYAEQLVASKIDASWRWVGIGWHPWDFESGEGPHRVRMQVRQSAAKQVWPRPQGYVASEQPFATTIKPKPNYVERYNLGLKIEKEGRFCEMYVFAWHATDNDECDHRLPSQWLFFALPEKALQARECIKVRELDSEWLIRSGGRKSTWGDLGEAIESVALSIRADSLVQLMR